MTSIEEYVDDQTSNTQVPEGTVGHGYDSGFHPHPDYIGKDVCVNLVSYGAFLIAIVSSMF